MPSVLVRRWWEAVELNEIKKKKPVMNLHKFDSDKSTSCYCLPINLVQKLKWAEKGCEGMKLNNMLPNKENEACSMQPDSNQ